MLIQSKITQPILRHKLVNRPRLIEQLKSGEGGKLTLLVGPAGFGKTSLTTQWINDSQLTAAWYSIDETDSTQGDFFRYLLASLQKLDKSLETPFASLAGAGKAVSCMEVVSKIIVVLAERTSRIFLVLNDYHLVDSQEVHEAIFFLVRHLPQSLHLVFTSRKELPFALSRHRAMGDVNEINSHRLKFAEEEAAELLQQVSQAQLAPWQLKEAYERTEGWPIGLQMTALSLRNNTDDSPTSSMQPITNKLALDYLLEEVLQSQSQEMQDFLVRTSILQRLHPDLCNALLEIENSSDYLNLLEAGGVPIVPLDEERQWYRYHHLLTELLRSRLDEPAVSTSVLHIKASTWYAERDFLGEAFYHAFASKNFDFTADLLEQRVNELIYNYETNAARYWINKLPKPVLDNHFLLKLYDALAIWSLEDYRDMDARIERLDQDFERLTLEFPRWKKSFAADLLQAIKVGCLFYKDFSEDSIEQAQKALESFLPESSVSRGIVGAVLGSAYNHCGDLIGAELSLQKVIAISPTLISINLMLEVSALLADTKRYQGKLRESEAVLDDTMLWVEREKVAPANVFARLSVRRAYIEYHRNNLHAAMKHVKRSIEHAKKNTDSGSMMQSYHVESLILVALGKHREVVDLIEEAREIANSGRSTLRIAFIETVAVELALMLGEFEKVSQWVEREERSVAPSFNMFAERKTILLAKWALMQNDPQKAIEIVDALRPQSAAQQRYEAILTMDIIHAVALNALEQPDAASAILESAVSFAQDGGYIRPFVEYASDLYNLLLALRKSSLGTVRVFVPALIKACTSEIEPASSSKRVVLEYGEILTPRETEIVQFIYSGMTNKEIAETRFVSLNTVKTHVKSVFGKLRVGNRKEMIFRVKELGLV